MSIHMIAVAGPTAVGKTAVSVELARLLDGEIISADSMQVYRGMDIGTAKVTKEEMKGVRHWMIDVLDPSEPFDVVRFQSMAKAAAEDIAGRGKPVIVAGGTGFYLQALLRDIDFTETAEDADYRRELEEKPAEELYRMVEEVDPESAIAIHANNKKRLIRALEFYRQTGTPISAHNEREKQRPSPYDTGMYFLDRDRAKLYARIEQRVDAMFDEGLAEEVRRLYDAGAVRTSTAMQGLGYKELYAWCAGECTLDEARALIKLNTRHFAKRQLTWFRHTEGMVRLDVDEYGGDAAATARVIAQLEEERQRKQTI